MAKQFLPSLEVLEESPTPSPESSAGKILPLPSSLPTIAEGSSALLQHGAGHSLSGAKEANLLSSESNAKRCPQEGGNNGEIKRPDEKEKNDSFNLNSGDGRSASLDATKHQDARSSEEKSESSNGNHSNVDEVGRIRAAEEFSDRSRRNNEATSDKADGDGSKHVADSFVSGRASHMTTISRLGQARDRDFMTSRMGPSRLGGRESTMSKHGGRGGLA